MRVGFVQVYKSPFSIITKQDVTISALSDTAQRHLYHLFFSVGYDTTQNAE